MNEGTLNTLIINSFNSEFEQRCVDLLLDAYVSVQSARCIDGDCGEEYISAVLLDHVDKSARASKWRIGITPEYRKYKDGILKGKKSKKPVPEINMKFGGWTDNKDLAFFIKSQTVTEIIEEKRARKRSPIIISDLHKRYIATIDNCLSNKYPSAGCIISYVTLADIEHTVNCINHCLCDYNRVPEILIKRTANSRYFNACYVSTHENRSIKHLMFDFSNDNNKADFNQTNG
jgi:hypothetical protein